jgi:tRNA nucleotidyltransferase (CCA-adding enzyme)
MKEHAHLLSKISIERIFIELDKLLIADFWQKGFRELLAMKPILIFRDFRIELP